MLNSDMPAMPVHGNDGEPLNMLGDKAIQWRSEAIGMTKRELVAMHCAAAAFGRALTSDKEICIEEIAHGAVCMADQLFETLYELR